MHAQAGAPLNSRSAVRTATPLAEHETARTTLLYAMGRPSASAATSRRLPPAWGHDGLAATGGTPCKKPCTRMHAMAAKNSSRVKHKE